MRDSIFGFCESNRHASIVFTEKYFKSIKSKSVNRILKLVFRAGRFRLLLNIRSVLEIYY